jgi:hypothetical protein
LKHRIFLWICVFALTPVKGFLGLGKLMHHYIEHKEKKSDLGVVEFLYIHYGSEMHEKDGHPQTDHQLPFLTLDAISLLPNLTMGASSCSLIQDIGFFQEFDSPITPNFEGLTGVCSDIWQPPKLG